MGKYVFNINKRPRSYPPVVKYNGRDVMSAENITTILGKKKSGKSLLTMDLLRAAITGESSLGFDVKPCPDGKKVYYLDTEMAKIEFYNRLKMLLGDVESSKLVAVNINEMSHDERRRELASIKNAHIIFIDGIVDLLIDFNDIHESREVVELAKRASIRNSCPVACVLHLNPNDPDFITKGRGNLGTELANKGVATIKAKKIKPEAFEARFYDLRNGDINTSIFFEFNKDTLVTLSEKNTVEKKTSVEDFLSDGKVRSLKDISEGTGEKPYTINKILKANDKVKKVSRGKYRLINV